MRPRAHHPAARVLASSMLACTLGLAACGSTYRADSGILGRIDAGEFGDARVHAAKAASEAPRDDLLTRLKSLQLTLAEGLPANAEADEIGALLRDQGTNEKRNASLILAGERLARVWKGEPFEQAMARYYLAVSDAVSGDWGNARASMADARFLMEGFASTAGSDTPPAEAFVLGLAFQTLGAAAIGEREEVRDLAAKLRTARPDLAPIADAAEDGFNTLLIIDAGLGPEKVAAGSSGEIAGWRPRDRHRDRPISVAATAAAVSIDAAADVNQLAAESDWRYLEGTRRAKSTVGDAMILGGAVTTQASDDDGARLAGVVAIGIGALLKSSARADLRHLETLPQAVYLVPLDLPPGTHTLRISLAGDSNLVLPAVRAGTSHAPTAAYVRLPSDPAAWVSSGDVRYTNDLAPTPTIQTGPLDWLPYVLGGRDTRRPTRQLYDEYINLGWPTDISYQALIDAYKDEGIVIVDPQARIVESGRHVLERGHLLYTPRNGSAAFARLYAREHPPYEPRSERTRALAAELQTRLSREGTTQ